MGAAGTVVVVVEILAGTDVCTVIVTVDADGQVPEDVVRHARLGVISYFGEFDGFIAGALHVSSDGERLVQYLQWDSEAAYVRCRDDPWWDELSSTERFMSHVRAGRVVIDVRVFAVAVELTQQFGGPGDD